jgi:hypothetical protein
VEQEEGAPPGAGLEDGEVVVTGADPPLARHGGILPRRVPSTGT